MIDRILIKRIGKGDKEAFDNLVKRHYPTVLNFAKAILGSEAIAGDVAQEVFIRLWETRDRKADISSVRNYLLVSTRNLALNHIRAERRLDERHGKIDIREEDLLATVIEEETRRLLLDAIEKLPARSAMVIRLTMQGRSNEEISREMNISVNTVKSTKAYAIKKLRKRIGDIVYILL